MGVFSECIECGTDFVGPPGFCGRCEPRSFPVTDPYIDAPDGAVVDGYERHGRTWEKVPGHKPPEVDGKS